MGMFGAALSPGFESSSSTNLGEPPASSTFGDFSGVSSMFGGPDVNSPSNTNEGLITNEITESPETAGSNSSSSTNQGLIITKVTEFPEPPDLLKNEEDRNCTKASAGPSGSHEKLRRASEGDRREVPGDINGTATVSSQDGDVLVSEVDPTKVDRTGKDNATSSQGAEFVSAGNFCKAQVHAKQKMEVDGNIRQTWLDEGITLIGRILRVKDGECKLDAIAMACLHRNMEVLSLLNVLKRGDNIWGLKNAIVGMECDEESLRLRARLRTTTECWGMQHNDRLIFIGTEYMNNRDFNFLPWGEYLFHRLLGKTHGKTSKHETVSFARSLWEAVHETKSEPLKADPETSMWQFLLQLQDGQGRTPFDIAVDEERVDDLTGVFSSDKEMASPISDKISSPTVMKAFYRATARGSGDGRLQSLRRFMEAELQFNWNSDEENAGCGIQAIKTIDDKDRDFLSLNNGFKGRRIVGGEVFEDAPIYRTLITYSARELDEIYYDPADVHSKNKTFDNSNEKNVFSDFDVRFSFHVWRANAEFLIFFLCPKSGFNYWFNNRPCAFNSLELATLLGEWSKVKTLLRLYRFAFGRDWTVEEKRQRFENLACGPQAIHFAAHHGSYKMLKEIMDNPMIPCDPLAEDADGNTALHYAMKMVPVEFEAHLFDYVSCDHLRDNDPRTKAPRKKERGERNSQKKGRGEKDEKTTYTMIERQGSITRLLQAGCDIFKANKQGQIPYPGADLGMNPEFLKWWYEKQAKEFADIQNTVGFAANAISVTATLVATASYVGPLQPPLGYGDDDQLQAKNLWVRTFIVCDTLSFYLAIASITFSLIPSLPMPAQPMTEELRRKKLMVIVATVILFPSIVCILLAFAASSMAVTGAQGPSSTGGRLTIGTSSFGALVCFVGFLLFSIRVVRIMFPRSKFIRSIYDRTSF